MRRGYVKPSERFLGAVRRSLLLLLAGLAVAAAFLPAPLEQAADPAATPNPAKSAWFLLWVQELASWSRYAIYPVLLFALLFLALPWLPVGRRVGRAGWFPGEQRTLNLAVALAALGIVALTVVARFYRGADWGFTG